MKRKRIKREKLLLMRRSVNVIGVMMAALYGYILLTTVTPIWVMGRDFVMFSFVAVVSGLLLQRRFPKVGGILTFVAGVLQTGVLIGVMASQDTSVLMALVIALLYTLPIIGLGAAQWYWAHYTLPPDESEGELGVGSRLELPDTQSNEEIVDRGERKSRTRRLRIRLGLA
jgi:hypothetical protein